jgi:Concanavalin A-like lectin/glucanases superfamily
MLRFSMASYSATVLGLNPYFYSRFGDSGATQTDIGSGANNMTLTATTPGVAGLIPYDGDTAVSFNGTTSYGVANINVAHPSGAFWIALLMRTTSASYGGGVLVEISNSSTDIPPGNWSPAMELDSSGHARGYLWDGGARTVTGTTDLRSANTTSHQIIYVADGVNHTIYVDGVQQARSAAGTPVSGAGYLHVGVGKGSPGVLSRFAGVVDEPALGSGTLTGAQITALWTAWTALPDPRGFVSASTMAKSAVTGSTATQGGAAASTIAQGGVTADTKA